MIEPKPLPSRHIHRLASLARWSLRLVLGLWLVLAVFWGLLHFWIVPRIDQWRPELQALASRSLGVPVTIGSLVARQDGLIPAFELTDVLLHDPERPAGSQSVALHLPRVVVAVSLRSLLTLGVEQIYLEAPELQVRRNAQGVISVAGIALAETAQQGASSRADWFLSQPEIAIRGGKLQWVDEMLAAPVLTLTEVDWVLRNKGWRHSLRLDATPPAHWGQRFTVMGQFKEPLLSLHEGYLQRWSGQIFADFAHIDLAQLKLYLSPQAWRLQQGQGRLRAWVDVVKGQPVSAVADVAVQALQLQWQDRPQPLVLSALQGRLRASQRNGYQLAAEGLQFTASDGLHWPRGDFRLSYVPEGALEQGAGGEHGELQADEIDLAVAAQLALRLPLPEAALQQLQALQPTGQLQKVKLSWRGPLSQPQRYKVSAQLDQLGLAAQPSSQGPDHAGMPGVQGLSGSVKFDQDSGEASLGKSAAADQATLTFPGVFTEPELLLDALELKLRWQIQPPAPGSAPGIKVQVPVLRFANADTAGQAQGSWHTGAGSAQQPRFPGVLDLQGQLSRADGARIYRYLPRELGQEALDYVRESIRAGQVSAVNFRVKGALEHIPFDRPDQGEFHISAQVRDVHYQFVPDYLLEPGDQPWPPLTRLAGELVFEGNSMQVRKAQGFLGSGSAAVVVSEASARVADWNKTEVEVSAKALGPLNDMLKVVQASALSRLTAHVLDESQATGDAQLALNLHLPTLDMDRSKVQGHLRFAGNTVQLMPQVPGLAQVRGGVSFSENGFELRNVQARTLGGEARIEGGMKSAADPVVIRAEGLATAQGLREARQLQGLPELAQHLQGQARYGLQIKVVHDEPEIQLQSDLQGMGVQLPAPLAKAPEAVVPLRISRLVPAVPAPQTEQISVQWGSVAAALVERDIHSSPSRLLRGQIQLGGAASVAGLKLQGAGLQAQVQLPLLDMDAWSRVLPAQAVQTPGASAEADSPPPWRQWLPQQLMLKAGELQWQGRKLHEVTLQLQRSQQVWNSQIQARELAGRLDYHEASPQHLSGLLVAKLSRLQVPPEVEVGWSQEQAGADEPLRELPALQVTVDDLRVGSLALGAADVQARNRWINADLNGGLRLREWELSRFQLTLPEAVMTGSGTWSAGRAERKSPGQTHMQFQLQLHDAGKLFQRLEMPGVVAKGQGRLQGDISWTGSPVTPDFKTLTGAMNLDVRQGQFLKADPGMAKLLGVLSLQALPRRLVLDFRDVFSNGFAFDFMRGDVTIARGVARTQNMQMKGVNAAVMMEGEADIDRETQDLHVVVVPEINALSASLVAAAINPVVGVSSFLAQLVLRGPLIAATTKEFRVHGSWEDPQVSELPRRNAARPGAAAQDPVTGRAAAPAEAGEQPSKPKEAL